MASYGSRKKVITRYEWYVPTTYNDSANWVEVANAMSAAMREYRSQMGWNDNISIADNAIRYSPGDEEIVIWFEVESA